MADESCNLYVRLYNGLVDNINLVNIHHSSVVMSEPDLSSIALPVADASVPDAVTVPSWIEERAASLSVPTIDEFLTERLSAEEKEMYEGLMRARYNSQEKYPILFSDLVKVLGYKLTESPREQLLKIFIENDDWVLLREQPKQTGRGGHNAKHYALTVEAAQQFALFANTAKGRLVRTFFVRTVSVLQDYHLLSMMVTQREKALEEEHRFLLRQHPKSVPVWYWILVDRREGYLVYKAGSTNNLPERIISLKRQFPLCYLRHVVQTPHNLKLEDEFRKHRAAKQQHFSEVINGHNHTELYRVEGSFTEAKAVKIVRSLVKTVGTDQELQWLHEERTLELTNSAEREREREKTERERIHAQTQMQLAQIQAQTVQAQAQAQARAQAQAQVIRDEKKMLCDLFSEGKLTFEQLQTLLQGNKSGGQVEMEEDEQEQKPNLFQEFRDEKLLAERNGRLEWNKALPAFRSWAEVGEKEIPAKKKAILRLFEKHLERIHDGRFNGVYLYGWTHIRLIE